MLNKQDLKIEQKIKDCVAKDTWPLHISNRSIKVREAYYIIGGLLVVAYETIPHDAYKGRKAKMCEKHNLNNHSLLLYMKLYRTCRKYGIGATTVQKYGIQGILVAGQFAKDDSDKFLQALDRIDSHGLSSVRWTNQTESETFIEITHLRFAVTPKQKDFILDAIEEFKGTHQGAKLVALVEAYYNMRADKAA